MARKTIAVPTNPDVAKIKSQARHRSAVKMAVHLIQFGKTWKECIEEMVATFDIPQTKAEEYYTEANKITKEKFKQWKEKVADDTYNKLMAIVEETYNIGDYAECRQSMELANKLAGNFVNKVELKQVPEFEIKLG